MKFPSATVIIFNFNILKAKADVFYELNATNSFDFMVAGCH
jgi:hypothetical protein